MASINFSGLGSGIDISTLVSQLVQAERSPVETRINTSAAKINAQLSAFGTIKSAMGNAQSALEKLLTSADTPSFKSTIQDKAGFTAALSSTATAGRYEVEVLSLAKSHKLTSSAFGAEATVGSGTLQLSAGEHSYELAFEDGATLSQIAAAINKAAGGKGVSASVVMADDGHHLVLNATSAGTGGALKLTASGGDGGLAALNYDPVGAQSMTQTTAASDAQVKVDGFLRTASSNTVSDLIPGVALTLTEAKVNEKFSLQVSTDNSTFKSSLASFVSSYNAANTALRTFSSYNAETQTSSALTGDSLVRSMQGQLRSTLGSSAGQLAALGVTIAKDGSLSLDTSKTESTLASNPEAGRNLLGKDGSVGGALKSLFNGFLNASTGALTQRTNSLNKRIEDLSSQVDALDLRMDAVKARYTAQFTAMDTLVAQLNSTSSFLTSALAKLDNGKS